MSHSRPLAILFALALTACGEKQADQSQPAGASPTTKAPVASADRRKLESPRDSAIVNLIVRGDSALAHGDSSEAHESWKIVLAFDSTDAEAREKLGSIRSRGVSASIDEAKYTDEVTRVTNHDRWCQFQSASVNGDLTNLRMLSDRTLIPTVRTAGLRAPAGMCDGKDAFLFLGRPKATMAEVLKRYGTPDAEQTGADGKTVIDYGRFRLFGTAADGKLVAVVIPPLT